MTGCLCKPLLKMECWNQTRYERVLNEGKGRVLQGTIDSPCDEHSVLHLVETVPDLLQIVQKGKTMGVCSLEKFPTHGQMDVSEWGQILF